MPRVIAAISTAIIFILLALGGLLSYFITLAQVPGHILSFLTAIDAGPIVFLLVVNIAFLIAGMFIDPNSALLILVPPLYPVATAMGIDPVHFGMIVTLNMSVGMITPPFGVNLFAACTVARISLDEIIKHLVPFVLVVVGCLMVITYVPWLSLALRDLVFAAPVVAPVIGPQ